MKWLLLAALILLLPALPLIWLLIWIAELGDLNADL